MESLLEEVMAEFIGGPADGRVSLVCRGVTTVMIASQGRVHCYWLAGDIHAPELSARGHRIMRYNRAVAAQADRCSGG